MSLEDDPDTAKETLEARPPHRTGRRRWLQVLDAIVFGGALLLTVIGVSSAIAQPFARARVLLYLLLAPSAMIVFHRSLAFLQRRMAGSPAQRANTASRGIGPLKWLGAPLAAVLACGSLEAFVHQHGLTVVRGDLGPVVGAIEAKLSSNEPAPDDIVDALGAASEVNFVAYFPKQRAFVVATNGGSIDMDGETIYYDSQDREWHRFHNDLAETDDPDAARFTAATRDIRRIQYRRPDGSWTRVESY
jgi:hypothetical protein